MREVFWAWCSIDYQRFTKRIEGFSNVGLACLLVSKSAALKRPISGLPDWKLKILPKFNHLYKSLAKPFWHDVSECYYYQDVFYVISIMWIFWAIENEITTCRCKWLLTKRFLISKEEYTTIFFYLWNQVNCLKYLKH